MRIENITYIVKLWYICTYYIEIYLLIQRKKLNLDNLIKSSIAIEFYFKHKDYNAHK